MLREFASKRGLKLTNWSVVKKHMFKGTDYGRPVRKSPSLYGRKSNPNPKYIGMAETYFVCHISPKFQISLIYAFIGCP